MGFQPAQMQESVLGKYLMQIAENRNRNNAQNQDYAFQREQTKKGQEFTTGEREAGETFTHQENADQIEATKALTDARIGWERDSDNPQQQELEMKKAALLAETDAGSFLTNVPDLWDKLPEKDKESFWEDGSLDMSELLSLGDDLSNQARTQLSKNPLLFDMLETHNKGFLKGKTDELERIYQKVLGAMGNEFRGDDKTEMLSGLNAIFAGKLGDYDIPRDEYGLYGAQIPSNVPNKWSTKAGDFWNKVADPRNSGVSRTRQKELQDMDLEDMSWEDFKKRNYGYRED